MKNSLSTILIACVLVIAAISTCVFSVYETDRAIITRLGELRKNSKTHEVIVMGPGLHFKLPLIDQVNMFDARLSMTEIPSERIVTKEKEVLLIDSFVEWRIDDYALFYNTTQGRGEYFGGRDRAEQLLRQKIKGVLHAEFGQRLLQDVISGERKLLMEKLVDRINEDVKGYGMKVVDVRVNRAEYPPEVNDKVFARMSSERKQVAVRFRANGESKAAIIRADADRTARIMIAEAEKEASQIKGEGNTKAIQVYADSYNKSPEFFEFYRSLEAYKKAFQDKQDVLVLKPEGAFFKYFIKGPQNTKEPE
jgi:modulator of FtsH protease HflC